MDKKEKKIKLEKISEINKKLAEVNLDTNFKIIEETLASIVENTGSEVRLKTYFNDVLELLVLLSQFNFAKETVVLNTINELEKIKSSSD